MDEPFTVERYEALLRADFAGFAHRAFCELNPRAGFAMNWLFEAIAAKLTAVRTGRVGRMMINLPPRHLKSHLASVAFPAWCLGHLYKQQYEAQRRPASQTTRPNRYR